MSVDPGRPNAPVEALNPKVIPWAKEFPVSWWRNAHARACSPLAFTSALGRFSGPGLPPVLYLADNRLTGFWESGLGRDLNARMPDDRSLAESDLRNRIEYQVRIRPKGLRIFPAADAAARRSVGAKTVACFSAEHGIARAWAGKLREAGADGILCDSTRQNPGRCLALFETPRSAGCILTPRKAGSAYDNPTLLAALFAEGVSIVGA